MAFISIVHICILASYTGRVGGERRPGIDCLCMRDHSQKNLGIHLRLEIVSKIHTDTAVCQLNYLQLYVENNCRVYEGKDDFLRLPTT